ncbi:MAG: sigma 54-interacting transcriptional regulator [Kofleriaceae bacterium]
MADTTSLVEPAIGESVGAKPQLVVALYGDAAPWLSRHVLDDIDVVELGRGRTARAERTTGTVRRLALSLPDRAISERHARLTRVRGRWVLEDLGAKNPCLVNGSAARETPLADADTIELGRTVLVFRDAVAPVPGAPDARLAELVPALPALRTFSGPTHAVHQMLAAVAPTTLPIILHGASGTGKERVARAIHQASRRDGPFIAVNCAAIPAQLLESELFGHRRGAFSGAVTDRAGHVRAAHGGTLLLDEIAELTPAAQAALLRVLQEREVVPVGDSVPVAVDVRVIAATHAELRPRAADGRFRADLLARLDGLTVELPALADRREDLGMLVTELARDPKPWSAAAARALFSYDWPGNIRELDMTLQRASALAGAASIELAHLPPAIAEALEDRPRTRAFTEAEHDRRTRLVGALTEHRGNVSAVARAFGKARWQIHRWMHDLAIDPAEFRE